MKNYRLPAELRLVKLVPLAIALLVGACGGGSNDAGNAGAAGANAPTAAYLTVTKSGTGLVTSSPSGISCGSTCSSSFTSGSAVTLTAQPASGYTFSGWTGACTGTGSCVVTMSSSESVSAAFTAAASTTTGPAPPWVYNDGTFGWGGAWGDVTLDYTATAVPSLSGAAYVMEMPAVAEWEYWLPYPPVVPESAASQPPNSLASGGNGIGFNTAGYNYITISIWPTQSGATANMGFFEASGSTTDIVIPGGGSIMAYGPATMTVGAWNTYKIPLTALGLPPGGQWIYKFIVQQQGNTPQVWYMDQVGFTAD